MEVTHNNIRILRKYFNDVYASRSSVMMYILYYIATKLGRDLGHKTNPSPSYNCITIEKYTSFTTMYICCILIHGPS
jgi:hypothetical protein